MFNLKCPLVKKFLFTLACISIGFFSSCSQEEIVSNNNDGEVTSRAMLSSENKTMSISEFTSLVQDKAKPYELAFLESLPQDLKIYVFPQDSKQFSPLKEESFNTVKSLMKINNFSIKKDNSPINIIKSTSAKGITIPESFQRELAVLETMDFGDITLLGTFNYIYDVENDKITEAKSLVCDLRDNPAGEFFYDWVDKGTSVTVSFDGLGLQYHVNGDVVLGVAIGDFPVGFVCYEVRQLTGEEMLPPR